MTPELLNIIIAVIVAFASWTATIVGACFWLAGKFRSLEKLIYHELNNHKELDDRRFEALRDRIVPIELKVMGVSKIP